MALSKRRNSSIELLRILAILMIIGHHFAIHSQIAFPSVSVTFNRFLVHCFDLGGKIGVDVFVLISGYYLIRAEKLRISKVWKLWGQLFFYSAGLYLLCSATGIFQSDHFPFYQALLPLHSDIWWFATTYFLLYLLTPLLNLLLNSLSRHRYRILLAVSTTLCCLFPTFLRHSITGELGWFLYLYCLAGYLRLYGSEFPGSSRACLMAAGLFMVLNLAWALLCDLLGTFRPGLEVYATGFFGMDQLPILVTSLFLLLGFLRLEMDYIPWVNQLAKSCFGVYLIHDSPYIRYWLWNTLIPGHSWADSPYLGLYALSAFTAVFVVCSAIDLIRIAAVEKAQSKLMAFFRSRK